MRGMHTLWLAGNQLQVLPSELSQCTQLTALLVDRNDLQSLPRSITALPNLHTLSVDRKTFALLDPAVLTFCTALPTFDILGL
ncbi:hypothetical protein DYB28_016183 [Aphanomyces astaci]|uniref:Uncharacterized protein n=1 Tax=Aphanomyces astaci TaxID=112090 RepID=A0A9X8DYJ5_APHAT|nr:hypothetical protein DYB28_016183 [Aphanomyces astaci]